MRAIHLTTMTILAPLAQVVPMRTVTLPGEKRSLHLYPRPFLQPVRHPFCVRAVENRLAELLTLLAPLMVNSRVISFPGILSDRDGDFLARPAVGVAILAAADEAAHDVGVVFFGATSVVGVFVEVVVEVIVF